MFERQERENTMERGGGLKVNYGKKKIKKYV